MRTIGVITTSRADWGHYRPVLRKIVESPSLDLVLDVGGTHYESEYGRTIREIRENGFAQYVSRKYEVVRNNRKNIDIMVVLGDRYEMASAVLNATVQRIPIAHIHGGEVTEGAFDDGLRHAITKLSHIHFVAAEPYAARVRQLGEEDWRIHVVGAPRLDELLGPLPPCPIDIDEPPVLVCWHPTTNDGDPEWQTGQLLEALDSVARPIVWIEPNADPGRWAVKRMILDWAESRPRVRVIKTLGPSGFAALMQESAVMVGNSSAGIIEAGALGLAAVNIGTRQKGRLRGGIVIDCGWAADDISDAITTSAYAFIEVHHPYGDGGASQRIVEVLETVNIERLMPKIFVDREQR